MLGLAGIISQRPSDECQRLWVLVGAMEYEAFYDSGTHSIPKLGIYTGWVVHERPLPRARLSSMNNAI